MAWLLGLAAAVAQRVRILLFRGIMVGYDGGRSETWWAGWFYFSS
jgi:hypothetical protein